MSAKELFEKLEYKQVDTIDINDCILYQNDEQESSIYFFPQKGQFTKQWMFGGIPKSISFEELQAINKQVEELGWNK